MYMIAEAMTLLYSIYNTAFQPILSLGPYPALIFFSGILALLFSGIRYTLLDHEKADKIQEKIQEHQEKMKEARENGEDDKASKHTKKVFKHNQKFMMLNMRPMIGTMVFVALIFPWLGTVFAPTIPVTPTGNQTYQGNFTYAQQETPITIDNTSEQFKIQLDNQEVTTGQQLKVNGFQWTVKDFKNRSAGLLSNQEGPAVGFNGRFVPLPINLPYIGDALNWLGFYIIIVMPITFILNKILGIQ